MLGNVDFKMGEIFMDKKVYHPMIKESFHYEDRTNITVYAPTNRAQNT